MKPVIIVSGLARCGTSLTMQMLHACGIRCAGEPPAFEPEETNGLSGPIPANWLMQFEAVKIIDPHRAQFPRVNALILWLDRDPSQQALSQLKMLRLLSGLRIPAGASGKMAKSLKEDRPVALNQFGEMPRLFLRFEDAIRSPYRFAAQICKFVSPHFSLNPEVMAACVMPRKCGAMCEASMDIEVALIERLGDSLRSGGE